MPFQAVCFHPVLYRGFGSASPMAAVVLARAGVSAEQGWIANFARADGHAYDDAERMALIASAAPGACQLGRLQNQYRAPGTGKRREIKRAGA